MRKKQEFFTISDNNEVSKLNAITIITIKLFDSILNLLCGYFKEL